MILPNNYEDIYPCINECGSTAKIYANTDYTKAYKIYRNRFRYDEEKFKALLSFSNPNCILPTDTLSIENNPNLYVGYEMDFDEGITLSKISNVDLSSLITASLDVPLTLHELSSQHFLIVDPNVDNITFSKAFKFVDTYSFLFAKRFTNDLIYERNMIKVNDTLLCGLIDFSYKGIIESYLKEKDSRYLELFSNLVQKEFSDENYVHDILSIVQDVTQEDELEKCKDKVLGLVR